MVTEELLHSAAGLLYEVVSEHLSAVWWLGSDEGQVRIDTDGSRVAGLAQPGLGVGCRHSALWCASCFSKSCR